MLTLPTKANVTYPSEIELEYSYTGFQQSQGDNSFPGTELDNDMANIEDALNDTIGFIRGSFNSNGTIKVSAMPGTEDLTAYVGIAEAAAVAADVSADAAAVSVTSAATAASNASLFADNSAASAAASAASAETVAANAGKIKITSADTTYAYLNSKVSVAGLLSKATTNPSANEVLALTVSAATNAEIDGGVDTAKAITSASAKRAARRWAPRGMFWGSLVNNVTDANNDIDFSHTVASDDSDPVAMTVALTKRLDAAWAANTNNGGLFTGAKANSTWYHCFVICDPVNGLYDAGFDTSITAANRPAAYTKYRRVGSILTDSSGNILQFVQRGREFIWVAPTVEHSVVAQATGTPTLRALKVPPGLVVKATFNIYMANGSSFTHLLVQAPDVTSTTASTSAAPLVNGGLGVTGGSAFNQSLSYVTFVNTSQQIRTNAVTSAVNLTISTGGWEDNLGIFN